MRDLTVPMGMSRTSAISLYSRFATSRSTTAARRSSASAASAVVEEQSIADAVEPLRGDRVGNVHGGLVVDRSEARPPVAFAEFVE